jgi:small-conductance mechanosensitive channel
VLAVRWLVLRALQRNFVEEWDEYRAHKVATYAATVVCIIVVAWVWIDAFNDLSTFLGLISAGIAIALADVLKNLAGWIYILTRRPFRVGDRVEVADTKGDVVDVRLFRFSLMEIGAWVDAEQSTGRLVHVPNGWVFTSKVANYTEGFAYIWHELPVLVTFESDHRQAREIVERALERHAPDVERTTGDSIRETAKSYHIRIGALTPVVYLTVRDSGVLLTARYLVGARQRRNVEQSIWTQILDEIESTVEVELAYPTIRTFFDGPVAIRSDPPAPAPPHGRGA